MTLKIITLDSMQVAARKRRGLGEMQDIPKAKFQDGFDLKSQFRVKGNVAEFINAGDFAAAFYARQAYEVDAGRDENPQLFQPFYSIVTDSSLPETINTNILGPTGVVFLEVKEGGEVQFASVGESSKTVSLAQYAVGLAYSEKLVRFNRSWQLPIIERRFGQAHNALLNHLHLSPILTQSYGAANSTDGTALTSFLVAASMPEKYLRAFEAAITASVGDTSNPRRGPYAILCATGDLFTIERALNRVQQQGFDLQSSAIGQIRYIVAYDGWTGTRGKKSVSYTGAAVGTAHLVHLGHKDADFQGFVQQPLRRQEQPGDMKRFNLAEVIYDTWLGVYSNPLAAVEEITLPVAASGAS